ncbi:MAG: hypothetical protein ACRDPA_00760 [Solirubrobacteraceae bacterium]
MTARVAAGIAFVAAWVTGLAVWPSNLDGAASGAKVISTYAGHLGAAMTQYVLVEGLAAIALAVVVIALARAAGSRGEGRLGRVVALAGAGAVIVSLVECALGLLLAGATVPEGKTDQAGTLFHLINRLDGAKMLALAAVALAGLGLARGAGVLPRWLGYVAALLAAAMVASGVGYLLLNNTVSQAAAVSLALLLVWVAGTGVTLGRTSR